ncbi:MAG: hypothetical protein J1E95_10985 [Muribaculaceae bacterium]|nr:hypothetical protein [Muribaculaceae bacterium]
MPCIKTRKKWPGFKPEIPEPFTLQDLVEDYVSKLYDCKSSSKKETPQKGHKFYLDTLKCTKDFICGEPNNADAPENKPYHINSHQRYFRFPSRHVHIDRAAKELESFNTDKFMDFEDLREKVKEKKLHGFGTTTLYDFCLRFGWNQNPKIEPKKYVYVHTKPKASADALKEKGYLTVDYDFRIPFDAFPEEITKSSMTAADVEHFLCCYKEYLEKLPNKK